MKNLAMWDVQYTAAPMEGRSWRQNKRASVVTTDIERAIRLVKESGEEIEIHQIIKRSSGEMIIDSEEL